VDLIIYSAGLPEHREIVRLALREHGRHAASPMSGVKSISWLDNVWAVGEAVKEGFDEVVMLNERGEVAECTSANIFAVKNEKILTPPLNSGCLEGVTRGFSWKSRQNPAYPSSSRRCVPKTSILLTKFFISSTNRNLISVGEIAGHKIPTPGPVCERLNDIFDAYVTEYVSRRLASAAR